MKEGWEVKRLGEVCEVFADGDWIESKDQAFEGIRLIQTGNVGNGYFKDRGEKARYISETTFKRLRCTEIFEGDCLISRLPDPVGRSCILPDTGQKMITAVDCTIVRFNLKILNPVFFNYFAQSNEYLNAVCQETTGTTRNRISRNNLGEIKIPLPPLLEQKRIVKTLDEAFAAIAKAKENAEKNLQNAREIFQSYLQSVFANPGDGWEEKTLGELTTKIGSGATPKGGNSSYKQSGISLVRSMNVYDNGFLMRNLAHIDNEQAKKLNNVTLFEGDVLLNITGASIARCCVVPKEILPARVNQHVSILRPKEDLISSSFLHFSLVSKFNKDRLLQISRAGGATREALTKEFLTSFAFPVPNSLKEQQLIINKLNTLSVETKKLEAIYNKKLTYLEELKKSILEKAFSGEL